ncbi:MFS transporter [Arthrobacter sp. Br18]|uniref:MFS transporter n=1 Tax=Arthrobacter sp. Br18 TaxID=1312954 RepID=UPI0004B296FE|nr:MFS transporter [Arthrobacter sp. Br18]
MFTVGYGANQFVPLLAVYRRALGLSDAEAIAVFIVYAAGLIPGLLVGGRLSDRQGRRRLLLVFAALSLAATVVLISGQWGVAGLYAGRFLTGIVSGAVFSIGTAWIKELSVGSAPGTGARRAALALTAGLGIGPLIAGILAQWAPAPQILPYLLHLGIAGAAFALLFRAPETRFRDSVPVGRPRLLPTASAAPPFRRIIVPMAPWVFGSVTLVFTTLAEHAVPKDNPQVVVFSGLLAAVALAAGAAVQPAGRRMSALLTRPGSAAAVGLAVVAAGCLAAAAATARPSLVGAAGAALLLGAGYGLCLIVGLAEVEELASADELGAVVALYYSLAYAGLAIPYLLALAAPSIGYPLALVGTAGAAVLTLAAVMFPGRRPLRTR